MLISPHDPLGRLMNELPTIPSQRCRAISPVAATFDVRGHPAGLVRHIDFLHMIRPDFAVGEATSNNENPMQASGRGTESRPICTAKLIEMERDKFVSIRILQIADKAVPNADTVFATRFLSSDNCRANARR
jgi:hypothetical protein